MATLSAGKEALNCGEDIPRQGELPAGKERPTARKRVCERRGV